jgi:hypothetical protein
MDMLLYFVDTMLLFILLLFTWCVFIAGGVFLKTISWTALRIRRCFWFTLAEIWFCRGFRLFWWYFMILLHVTIAILYAWFRYIEIFRSSLSEVRAAIGPKMRPMGPGGFNQRPAPYDRGDRFGGMNRYNNIGRGSRSFKGESVCVKESLWMDWPGWCSWRCITIALFKKKRSVPSVGAIAIKAVFSVVPNPW